MFAVTINPTMNMPSMVWLGVAGAIFAIVYFGGKALGKTTTLAGAAALAARATKFLKYVNSLGVPFLAPVLQLAAAGKFAEAFAALEHVFDQFDDPALRAQLLNTLETTRVKERLSKPDHREKLLQLIESELGIKIPRLTTPPAPPPDGA